MALLGPPLPFSGYSPNPQGPGYFFQKPDGGSYLAYGPEADRIRTQLDQMPDNRIASNDPNAGGMSAPEPMASVAPPEPVRQGQTVERAAPPPTEAAPQQPGPGGPPPPPPDGAELPPLPGTGPSASAASEPAIPPEGEVLAPGPRYVPGVDPRKMAASAVAVPTQQSMVSEGGIQDPKLREELKQNYESQVVAQKDLATVQAQSAMTALADQKAQQAEAMRRQQEADDAIAKQNAVNVLRKDEFQKRMNIAQADYDQQSGREVDQYRVFRGRPGARIVSLIGIALGGLGQGIRHGQGNPVLDQVNHEIDNDIAAQRDEIHQGIVKSGNDLARIRDQYGLDTEDASALLKYNYAKKADAEASKRAAFLGTQQAQLQYAQIAPTFLKWQADAIGTVQANLDGKIKMATESKMVQPTRGGYVAPTDKQITESYENAAKRVKAKYAVEHQGAAPPKAGAGQKLSGKMGFTEAINESAQEDLQHYGQIKGFVPPEIAGVATDERRELDARADAIAAKVIAGSGENMTEEGMHEMKSKLKSSRAAIREAAAREYLSAGKTVHRALERQRGNVAEPGGGGGGNEEE